MASGVAGDIGETPCIPVRGGTYRRADGRCAVPGDDKDWTWVLERACPECGLDAGSIDVEEDP